MAKRKDQTNVKENVKTTTSSHDTMENVEEALSRAEQFIENNQRLISIVVVALLAVVGGYFAFKNFYLKPQNAEAQTKMFRAEQYFERDSMELALKGDSLNPGFLSIKDDYSMTKAGELAEYYTGIAYLHKGEYDKAIEHLENFDAGDEMITPIAIGAIGDAYLEKGDKEKAVKYYLKAVDENPDNELTAPAYLMKAGLVYEAMDNYKEALEAYERIQKEYYNSAQSGTPISRGALVEKYIARAKLKLGQEL